MDELNDKLLELKFVEIKDGDKIIGYEARAGVLFESKVVIPSKHNGLPVISVGGFSNKLEIEEVVLPNSIIKISDCAFFYAHNLKSITFPKYLEEIGCKAFCGCVSLKLNTLPKGIKVLKDSVLYDTDMTEFVVPNSVKEIQSEALNTESLKVVEIPSSVKYIAEDAFYKDTLSSDYDLTILCHKNNKKYVMNLKVFEGEYGYYDLMDQYRHHTYYIEVKEDETIKNLKYEAVDGFGSGAMIGYKGDEYVIKTRSGRYYKRSGFWAPKYCNYND